MITLAISELAVLAGVQCSLSPAREVVQDYFVGTLRFDDVEGGILFRLTTLILNVLSHFESYKVSERTRRDPVFVFLAFYRKMKIDRSSSCRSNDFVAYDLATRTVQAYPAEKIAPVMRRMVDNGLAVPVIARAVHVNWLPGAARKTLSEVESDYQRYCDTVDEDAGQLADVPANVADDFDNVLGQEALREGDAGWSFTADHCSGIATALARLSRTVRTSGSDFYYLVKHLVDK